MSVLLLAEIGPCWSRISLPVPMVRRWRIGSSLRWLLNVGVLGLRILASIGLTWFGLLEIVFPGPFARIDLRFHRWLSRRVPALYAIPGMPHRLDERLQVRTTVLFGGVFVVVGVLLMLGIG